MESKDGEGRKYVIDAISKEDGDVSEILFSLDSKIVEAPDCLGRDCPNLV